MVIKSYIGENRNFGNNELYVDMIPSSCWFTNVRYCVKKEDWDKIRKNVYMRVGFRCECCFIDCIKNKIPIEAHERWDYDYLTLTQKLVRLIGLCKLCHQSTHLGFATINGNGETAIKHLQKVRNFTEEEVKEHIDMATAIWNERNQYEWKLNLDLITLNGFEIIKPVLMDDRKNIVEEHIKI